jgi:signal transduction histidine kinase
MAVLSEVVKRQTEVDHRESTDMLTAIADSARGLVDSMSDIVWSIDPRKDDLKNVVFRIRQFASDVLEAKAIDWEFKAPEKMDHIKLAPEQRRDLFLIFKEAINNVARHSECRSVSLNISVSNSRLVAEIRDDGCGFVMQPTEALPFNRLGGNGLKNMQARAADIGGKLNIVSSLGGGTHLILVLPLGRHSHKQGA